MTLQQVSDWAVYLGTAASSGFVLLYLIGAKGWWRTEEGWHLMTFTLLIAATLGWVSLVSLGVVSRTDNPEARGAIFVPLAAMLVWRLSILIRRQWRHPAGIGNRFRGRKGR